MAENTNFDRPTVVIRVVVRGDSDLLQAFALRYEVFSVEQGVIPEVELDDEDFTAIHVVATSDGEVIGTLRILQREGYTKIGRVAVAMAWRKRGVGRKLMEFAHEYIRKHLDLNVILHAQTTVQSFYCNLGYIAEGGEFREDGIPHIAMKLTLAP